VATIAPNTHAQLESFYAVPQLGAVLVPINYRLTAENFVYGWTATGKIQKFVLRKGAPNLARQQPGSAGSPAG
jgi:acyl-CoA synthetase (AMP-forming)/AMP-acid ligase II